MPRYCTEGQSVFKKFCGRKSASLFLTGTSAKKYHGETPKRRGKFVNCKNRSPSSLPRKDDAPALQKLDKIALPTKFPAFIAEIFDGISCKCVYSGVFAEDADEEDCILRLLREIGAAAADAIEIAAEILCCNADGGRRLFLQVDADLLPARCKQDLIVHKDLPPCLVSSIVS